MRPRRLLAALLVALPAGSCAYVQPTLDPRGPAAATLAKLGVFVLTVFGVVAVVMIGIVFWVALRRRGSFDRHEDPFVGGGQAWILIGGFLVPAVILAVVFVTGLQAMNAFPIAPGRKAGAEIVVTGHQWWWQVEYLGEGLDHRVTTANEIHIPAGQPVDITLQSADVIHSFWVPQLHGKVDLEPGSSNHIRIQADRPGRYRGECGEYCGMQHAHMVLWVTADAPAEYAAWLAREGAPAAMPGDPVAQRGRAIFESNACALCHTVRGTPARGSIGPDLTHIGSRPTIGAGTFLNDTAHLTAWVTHAQSMKPGAQMPDLAAFSGSDLHALVGYLQELR